MKTEVKYGNLPEIVGRIDLPTDEMMFWLYCPVSVPGDSNNYIPVNLIQYSDILGIVEEDLGEDVYKSKYIYLTVKTTHINKGEYPNRPGWHSDGFMTNDINYVWVSGIPTEYVSFDGRLVSFPTDHEQSMLNMEGVCPFGDTCKYPSGLLLKLDESVLHRPTEADNSGMRTFIKVSVSDHKYEHIGNSVNHMLTDVINPFKVRNVTRNCPVGDHNE